MEFIDIQVNGYAGIDFLRGLITMDQLQLVAARLRAGGVRAVLPTLTTTEPEFFLQRARHFRELIDQDPDLRRLMPAFHLEGPCISPEEGYRGAHDTRYIRPATREVLEPIVEAAGGPDRVAMVTLAPETDQGLRACRWLIEQGILVAIGHANTPLEVLRDAEAMGVRLFTHFGNGCAPMVPRHDNILNRAMSLERMRFSLIADGHHLPWFVLRNWIRWLGVDRCLFTTDCVSPADAPPGRYTVGHHEVEVGQDRRIGMPGRKDILAGSALTMRQAYANAIDHLGLTPDQARALCGGNPARLIARWLA